MLKPEPNQNPSSGVDGYADETIKWATAATITWLLDNVYIHCVSTNVKPLSRGNFDKREPILRIFGKIPRK